MQFQRGNIGLFFRGDPTILGWWVLDTQALDYSGQGNHGTYTYVSPYPDYSRIVPYFNGSSSTTKILDSSSLDSVTNKITVMAWVKRLGDQANNALSQCIMIKNDGATAVGYYLTLGNSTRGLHKVAIYQYGTTPAGYHVSNSDIPDNAWTLIGYTYDGSAVNIYINGKIDKTVAVTGNITLGTNIPLWIGGLTGTNSAYYNGLIKDAAVFSRALSPQEISAYYKWATGVAKKNYTFESIELPQPNFFPFF